MKFEQILQSVNKGEFAPVYLLQGDEPYFIDKLSNTIQQKALTKEQRDFNETVLYGKDTNVINLIHLARQFPMGAAPRQLIVVREAQHLNNIEKLESYFKSPAESTILVICYKYKKLDKRTKAYTALKKVPGAVIFECKKLYDNQVGQWITDYLKEKGYTIEPRALQMLVEFLGANLENIVLSIDKLSVTLGADRVNITVNDISKNIGVNKEYNPFELQNALINKDIVKSNRIVKAFAANPKEFPIPAITAILFNYFSKLLTYFYIKDKSKGNVASKLKINPFFVRDYQTGAKNYSGKKVAHIISLLREYDMKSKGYGDAGTFGGDLLKEMIYRILH
ncbi:DNA polymerase III subunit delta [Marinilabiliaceae bacterium ANBcel2]|nr:DNA polymerase III subunit delta [Marinilabiliaceae bacterium ANBcel2]